MLTGVGVTNSKKVYLIQPEGAKLPEKIVPVEKPKDEVIPEPVENLEKEAIPEPVEGEGEVTE